MAERRYLGEVQGLRVVAALLVAIYHIWLQRISGGVDVFFVVSAYFMTAAPLRREPMRWGDVVAQLSSTLRRIVPGAALVVAATVVACFALLPDPQWRQLLPHAWWSLLQGENLLLANGAIDYLAPRLGQTPFQQFWALSLQMQMLLTLPLIYFACSFFARRWGMRLVATLVFGAIFAASLAWSVVATEADQAAAYYLPTTRAWEFAAGALAALWIERVRLAPGLARLIGYAALLVLVSFGLVIDVSRQFPGVVAAVPVVCALAIILAAGNGAALRLLDNGVMRKLGELSFAFYLWHWPLLVLLRQQMQSVDVGPWGGFAIIGVAGLLAWGSTMLVETKVRRAAVLVARPLASLGVVALFVAGAAAVIGGWQLIYQSRVDGAEARLAAYLAAPDTPLAAGQMVPEPIIARFDLPAIYADSCVQELGGELIQCDYGAADAPLTVVAVGGSHMTQWMDSFDTIGRAQGFRVVSMVKNSCSFTSDRSISRSCTEWNDAAMAAISALKPDLVVALVTRTSSDIEAPEGIPHGYAAMFARLEAQHIPVLGLRDNPRFGFDVANCVARFASETERCGRARDEKLGDIGQMVGDMGPNISFFDTTDLVCDAAFCPAVKNGILLYRDAHHLTRTATLLMTDRLAAATAKALATPFGQEATP